MGRGRDTAGAPLDSGARQTSKASEARFFDGLVTSEGDFNPFTDKGWSMIGHSFAAAVGAAPKLEVLDVGCGTGQSRRVYAAHASKYVGIDLSVAALLHARQRAAGDARVAGDAGEIPFADASFDVVAFSSVLHHLPEPVAALKEARRTLRPGGWLFAFDPNLLHPPMALFRHPKSPFYREKGVSPNERPLMPRAVRRWFEAAELLVVRQRCQSGILYRRVAPRLLDRALPLYHLCDWLLDRSGLGRWLGSFIITVGRRPQH